MNAAQVLADAAAKVAATHRHENPRRRFPRHSFGPFQVPKPDTGWEHRDTPVVDLSEPRRRYDAGWVI